MLATYSELPSHEKRQLFDQIDTSGYDPQIAAEIYFSFIYHFMFMEVKSLQSNLSVSDWMDMVAEHASKWPPLKSEYEGLKRFADDVYKSSVKRLTLDDLYDKDELESKKQKDLKSKQMLKVVSNFRNLLQQKGGRQEALFKRLSQKSDR